MFISNYKLTVLVSTSSGFLTSPLHLSVNAELLSCAPIETGHREDVRNDIQAPNTVRHGAGA